MKIIHIIVLSILLCFMGCEKDESKNYIFISPETYEVTVTLSSPGGEVKTAFFSPEYSQMGVIVSLPYTYTEVLNSAGYMHYYSYKNQADGLLVMSVEVDNKPVASVVTAKEFRVEALKIEGFIIDEASEDVFFPEGMDPYLEISKSYPDIIYWEELDLTQEINIAYPGD